MVKTCPAAMGFSFATGTTDGPGAFDFNQGDDKVRNCWYMFDPSLYNAPVEAPTLGIDSFLGTSTGECILEGGEELDKNTESGTGQMSASKAYSA